MEVAASCCGAAGTGALHKIDGIMKKEHYMDISKATSEDISQEAKTWAQMGLQMDNDPKHTAKMVKKWLEDDKVKVLEWPPQSTDLRLGSSSSGRRNGPEPQQSTVRSLWKVTQNV